MSTEGSWRALYLGRHKFLWNSLGNHALYDLENDPGEGNDLSGADPARVAEGWERRFITDGTRLDEVVALYEAAGFEVCADPIRREEFPEDCDDCQLLALLRFRTIYTRRLPAAPWH
jgi:hypothetical protein